MRTRLAILALAVLAAGLLAPSPRIRAADFMETCASRFRSLQAKVSGSWRDLPAHVRAFGHNRKEDARRYFREVRDSNGLRLFIKERDGNAALNGWQKLNGFFANPVAVAFDRPREVTIPVSMVGWSVAFGVPTLYLEMQNEERDERIARELAQGRIVPGATYVVSLIDSGAVEPGPAGKAVNEHPKRLNDWVSSAKSGPLERVKDLVKAGILTSEEARALDPVMRKVYSETYRATEASDGNEFTKALQDRFRKVLQDPASGLSAKPEWQLHLISTAFWPSVRVGDRSDIELGAKLGSPELAKESAMPIQATARLLNTGQITIGEAYRMTASALDHPKKKDFEPADCGSLFPTKRCDPVSRPEMPRFSRELRFEGKTLEGERPRWRLLFKDPRFVPIAREWADGRMGDSEALLNQEALVSGMEQLSALDRAYSGKPLPPEVVMNLFGLAEGSIANPLLGETRQHLEALSQKTSLAPESLRSCLMELAELFRRTNREEEAQVASGATAESYSRWIESQKEKRTAEYSRAITNCASR